MSLVENLRQVSVGKLFSEHSNFNIPKYQRGYAWQLEQVEDFCADILKCINYRKINQENDSCQEFEHFFGGIVCIESKVSGSSRTRYDLVDGQQRIATFSMLANCLIDAYRELSNNISDTEFKELIDGRIFDLEKKYRYCEDEINKRRQKLEKLTLSITDSDFFKKEIHNQNPTPLRESNKRIKKALDHLRNFINKNISSDYESRVDDLKTFEEVLNDNCTLIQISTLKAKNAYKLFQVLNDRGLSLSEGDLLRAKTMELLESPDFESIQDEVGELWDEILREEPSNIKSYLSWYFSAVIGRSPKSKEVFDEYLKHIFKLEEGTILSYDDAILLKNKIKDIKLNIDTMSKLCDGEQPYEDKNNRVCRSDKDRLVILTKHLGHTNCIPLIFSAKKLEQKTFSEIVNIIEKFVFRYKIICNQNIGGASSIYLKHASHIIKNRDLFDIGLLKGDLQKLLNEKAPDSKFSEDIKSSLNYRSNKSKKNIKYALISLEEHWRSLDQEKNLPKVIDKTNIFDFENGTTIEHLYPQNPDKDNLQDDCEPIKHTLGNLTILSEIDNKMADNLSFEEKKQNLSRTNKKINQSIVKEYNHWDSETIKQRQDDLTEKLCRIFKLT